MRVISLKETLPMMNWYASPERPRDSILPPQRVRSGICSTAEAAPEVSYTISKPPPPVTSRMRSMASVWAGLMVSMPMDSTNCRRGSLISEMMTRPAPKALAKIAI